MIRKGEVDQQRVLGKPVTWRQPGTGVSTHDCGWSNSNNNQRPNKEHACRLWGTPSMLQGFRGRGRPWASAMDPEGQWCQGLPGVREVAACRDDAELSQSVDAKLHRGLRGCWIPSYSPHTRVYLSSLLWPFLKPTHASLNGQPFLNPCVTFAAAAVLPYEGHLARRQWTCSSSNNFHSTVLFLQVLFSQGELLLRATYFGRES